MYPNLFGIHNFSYTLCMIVGIVCAFFVAFFYFKKTKYGKAAVIDLLICGCFAIVGGIVFAILFENLYEAISLKEQYHWTFAMTFYGGLFGGTFAFILTYVLMNKFSKVNFALVDVVKIAPVSVLIAHGFGRIGCFLAGCCHGVYTDSWIGISFPNIGKVVPTQLIEAIVLFILFAITFVLVFKFKFNYAAVIYLTSYSIARFIIEFYRGDERGVPFALSPSQVWSIVLFALAIPTYFWIKRSIKK